MKCSKCGFEIAEKTEAFMLNRAQWGGDEKFCQCNTASEVPDVELISADGHLRNAMNNNYILHCVGDTYSCEEIGIIALIHEVQSNARAYGEQKQRKVDADICLSLRGHTGYMVPTVRYQAFEQAAEAIREGK